MTSSSAAIRPLVAAIAATLAASLALVSPAARAEAASGAESREGAGGPTQAPSPDATAAEDPLAGLTPSLVALKPLTSAFQHLYDGAFGPVSGVFFDPSRREIYVADANGVVGIFDENVVPRFAFGRRVLVEPVKVVADRRGRIYVIDLDRSRVRVFNYRGEVQRNLDVPGLDPAVKPSFSAMTVDADGNLYLGESASGQVLVLDPDGRLKLRFGRHGNESGAFQSIGGIAVDRRSIYVTDRQATPVQVFDHRGNFVLGWGAHDMGAQNFSLPEGIAVDAKGRVIVVDALRHEIKVFDAEGKFIDRWGGLGEAPGDVAYPSDVATDGADHVFVAEKGGKRLQEFVEVEGYRNAEGLPVDPAAQPNAGR